MLNWKNVQYANGSGLVNAIRDNNTQITEGNQQIIDSISQFGEDRTKLKTDSFINNLMQYKDQPDKVQGMIADADNSWLDMSRVSSARDDANKRTNTMADFQEKADYTHKNDMELYAAKVAAAKKKSKGVSTGDLRTSLTVQAPGEADDSWGWLDSATDDTMEVIQDYILKNGITDPKAIARVNKKFKSTLSYAPGFVRGFALPDGTDIEYAKNADLVKLIGLGEYDENEETAQAIEDTKKALKK